MQVPNSASHAANSSLNSMSVQAYVWLPAIFRIMSSWKLQEKDQATLLGVEYRTLHNWKDGKIPKKVPASVVERASLITGIYKALKIILPVKTTSDRWVSQANDGPLFHGTPPIERMLSGYIGDLYDIRRYLDALRGG